MAKEFLSIVISTAIWGPSLSGHKVLYQWGNSSVVAAICKGSARCIQLLCTYFVIPGFLLLTMMLILYVNILRGWPTLPQTTYPEITILCCCFFAEYRCVIAANPTPSSTATNHQHPRSRLDISTLQSVIQSSSLHTQALWHRHPAIALLLSKH